MDFLEDILQRYGIKAHYWPVPENPAPASIDEQANDHALFREAVTSSADWQDEFLAALDRKSNLSLYVSVGDIRTEHGQRDAALKAYEAGVLETDGAQRLCELGYVLLQRCRVDELPLCDKDFDGSFFDFDDGETLFISSHMSEFDNPGPEFPDKPALLDLAIRAFGLAHVSCMHQYRTAEKGATWEDRWHELVALEGLRAAFLSVDDLEGLEAVRVSFNCWIEDYGDEDEEAFPGRSIAILWMLAHDGHTIEFSGKAEWDPEDDPDSFLNPFVANFNRTSAYLRGRRKAAPSQEAKGNLRLLQEIKELGEAAHSRMDGMVEKLIDIDQRSELTWERVRQRGKESPEAEQASISSGLEARLGHAWSALEPVSQKDLICAKKMVSADCEEGRLDWYYPAMGYGKVTECELKKSMDYLKKVFGLSPGKKETLGELIHALRDLAGLAGSPKELSNGGRVLLEQRHISLLHKLNKINTRAKHEVVSRAEVLRMEHLLLESHDNGKPLLAVIAQARGSS